MRTLRPVRRRSAALALLLALAALPLHAQGRGRIAESYEARLAELRDAAASARAATVTELVLVRDAARLELTGGRLYLLGPVGGRTVAAVYEGRGTFTFAAPEGTERRLLERRHGSGSVDAKLEHLVLLFADTTAAELERRLAFAGAPLPGALKGRYDEFLEYLADEDDRTMDPELMEPLLNGRTSPLFYAQVGPVGGDPFAFTIVPDRVEGIQFLHRARVRGGGPRFLEITAQFRPRGDTLGPVDRDRLRQADVRAYGITTTLTRTGTADLAFAAEARLELTSRRATVGPWVPLVLFAKLTVDSARWADGTPATVHKPKDSSILWVHLGDTLAAGDVRPLTLWYRGDLIDRYADFFFIKGSSAWYPRSLDGRAAATFDLTFHTPTPYLFASIGKMVDSSVAARVLTTRWVSEGPMRNASFNLGLFKEYPVRLDGAPPVSVFWAEEARRQGWLPKGSAKEQVGDDVAKALKFFQHVFGPGPSERFYATEIPYGHGEAFPGLVHLSAGTFMSDARDGSDEWFRAHEVAHQWWGIGVDFASYRDQWLSEGMSSFAGLWYLQTARGDNKRYFGLLDRWRDEILRRRKAEEPIALGWRVAGVDDEFDDYSTIVYRKGAWVAHMLRVLMLDLRTMNEDRFTAMLREFYATHRGRRASTDDLRRTAEKYAGTDLGWFFDQWVHGTAIPRYRASWRTEQLDGGKHRVTLRVEQHDVPEDFTAYVPVTVVLGKDAVARMRVKVQGPVTEVALPLLPGAPAELRFNDLSGVLAQVEQVRKES